MTDSVSFRVEPFGEALDELRPLLELHAEEVRLDKMPVEFEPDFAIYDSLVRRGSAFWITARNEATRLVGYAMFFLSPVPAYRGAPPFAVNEAIYLLPHYRNGFAVMRMIRFCEDEAARRGAVAVNFHVWLHKNFGGLLGRCGYSPQQISHLKWLPSTEGRSHV